MRTKSSFNRWSLRCKKLLMALGLASLAALPVAGAEWHVSGYGIKWNGQYDLDSVPEEHADEPGCTFVFIDVLSEISFGGLAWSEISKEWVKVYADDSVKSYGVGIPYTIYRDDVAIATGVSAYGLDGSIWFTDYDAVPGRSYNYEVRVSKEDVAKFLDGRTLTSEFAGVFTNAEDFTSGALPFRCYFSYTAEVGTNEVAFTRDGGEQNVGLAIYKETETGSIRDWSPPVSVYSDEDWLCPRFDAADWQRKKIVIWTDENDTGSAREGVVTILYPAGVGEGYKWQIKVTQAGNATEIWTLKYHSNNGKNDLDTQNFKVGEEKRLYYMNSRLGWEYKDEDGFNYVFMGWAKSPTGGVAFENGALVKDLADKGKVMHIYAVWQKRAYNVCFHSNDGRGKSTTQEFRPNIAKNLLWLDSGLGWTRSGYDFLGWSKAPTSTAVVYTNGQSVNNLVAQGQKLHLYAVWRDRRWTIRYHRNYSSTDGEYVDHKIPVGASVKLYWLDSQLGWTRNGYSFKGWAKSRTAGAAYQNGQVVKDLVPGGQVLHIYGAWGQKTN